jgi:hypothetical protein
MRAASSKGLQSYCNASILRTLQKSGTHPPTSLAPIIITSSQLVLLASFALLLFWTMMDVDAKYDLICRGLPGILKGEEIRKILEEAAQPDSKRVLKLYWGASFPESACSQARQNYSDFAA